MPAIKHNALTAAQVRALKEPGTYADGNGLNLRIDAGGGKRWFQRITVDGKRRNVGLGAYPAVSLSDARHAALDNLAAIRQGIDPIAEKRAAREIARRPAIPTFRQASQIVINLRGPRWGNARHQKQWPESLAIHAFPLIGHKTVDSITTADTLAVLEPIWLTKCETARRLRQRMNIIFDYCIAQRWRHDNPAGSAVTRALPRQPSNVRHHPAVPYNDIPEAIRKVQSSKAKQATKLAFEFMVLTAARPGEALGAEWTEIDLDAATWIVPAERFKLNVEHRVPLSRAAKDVLEQARELGDADLVFPSPIKRGKPLTNAALEQLVIRLKIAGVPHGCRSTFKDWTAEQTDFPRDVSEAALGHTVAEKAEKPYLRTDLFERRRELMEVWGAFVCGVSESAAE